MLFVSTGDHIIPDELIIPKCFSRRYQTPERGRFSSDLEIHCILHDESGVGRNEIENVSTDCINKVMKTARTLMKSDH